eukprot:EG_transcript_42850
MTMHSVMTAGGKRWFIWEFCLRQKPLKALEVVPKYPARGEVKRMVPVIWHPARLFGRRLPTLPPHRSGGWGLTRGFVDKKFFPALELGLDGSWNFERRISNGKANQQLFFFNC